MKGHGENLSVPDLPVVAPVMVQLSTKVLSTADSSVRTGEGAAAPIDEAELCIAGVLPAATVRCTTGVNVPGLALLAETDPRIAATGVAPAAAEIEVARLRAAERTIAVECGAGRSEQVVTVALLTVGGMPVTATTVP